MSTQQSTMVLKKNKDMVTRKIADETILLPIIPHLKRDKLHLYSK
ncbi:MAG: hypothetical protein ABIK26_00080 [Candidatus Omnitrophota bacterium]